MMDQDYLFFRENLKRTILSQSRYLCPRSRLQLPHRPQLGYKAPMPRPPRKKRKPEQSPQSSAEFPSATSLTTEISSKTGRRRTCLKVTIPTARPLSVFSDDSSSVPPSTEQAYKPSTPQHYSYPTTADYSYLSPSPLPNTPEYCSTPVRYGTPRYPRPPTATDSDCLSPVISGVCLLKSLEEIKKRGNRVLQVDQIRGVKSVLHKQI